MKKNFLDVKLVLVVTGTENLYVQNIYKDSIKLTTNENKAMVFDTEDHARYTNNNIYCNVTDEVHFDVKYITV